MAKNEKQSEKTTLTRGEETREVTSSADVVRLKYEGWRVKPATKSSGSGSGSGSTSTRQTAN